MRGSKYSNSIPQSRQHPRSKHKLCAKEPPHTVIPEQHHVVVFNQRPSDFSIQQSPLPITIRTQQSNELLEDIKFRSLHGVLNLKAEYEVGPSRQKLIRKVTSDFPTSTLEQTTNELPEEYCKRFGPSSRARDLQSYSLQQSTNEIPLDAQLKYWKYGRSHRQTDLQSDLLTKQTTLPLPMTTLKRTTNELPEDIMQMILKETKSDQQNQDHLPQQSTLFYPNGVKGKQEHDQDCAGVKSSVTYYTLNKVVELSLKQS